MSLEIFSNSLAGYVCIFLLTISSDQTTNLQILLVFTIFFHQHLSTIDFRLLKTDKTNFLSVKKTLHITRLTMYLLKNYKKVKQKINIQHSNLVITKSTDEMTRTWIKTGSFFGLFDKIMNQSHKNNLYLSVIALASSRGHWNLRLAQNLQGWNQYQYWRSFHPEI